MAKEEVGKVAHFFGQLSVAAIDLIGPLKVGDKIVIEGSKAGPVEQVVETMQIELDKVESAGAGQSVGIKVAGKVHVGNKVFKVSE